MPPMRIGRWVIVVAALALSLGVVLHTLFDADGWTRRVRVRDDLAEIRADNDRGEARAQKLRSEIRALRTRREVKNRVIRDELGYVCANEVVLELGDRADR